MLLPSDYAERVYAGVLGKLIGVYLGRPFEGWSYARIQAELGDISYYVHDRLNVPLIVTDDDISGTFTFLRALPDYDHRFDLTPAQIGQSWLNYIIEQRTILWWGGIGNSTEHTAYLRLKHGVEAPTSGSAALNGKVVSEQIGAQIFIDGWAMVTPGDPERAADLARRAASVSHDGEAIYGAQVIAAMEAQAFVEHDRNQLLDTALRLIPGDSLIYRMIHQIRAWHATEPDWRKTRAQIAAHYGYDQYGGNCHIIPNHALIILALLYGDDDFQKSLMIVNTSGWDTDCNADNLGCLLGIKNGLAGIDAGPDWRGPIADRMYLATAEGGRGITDAAAETYAVVNIGRALAGVPPVRPKHGARFHFELPGSVQGFTPDEDSALDARLAIANVPGHSCTGTRALAFAYTLPHGGHLRAATPTFIPSREIAAYFEQRGYPLFASPTLYSGQTIHTSLVADITNVQPVQVALYLSVYQANDDLERLYAPTITLAPGAHREFSWAVPATAGQPIAGIGFEIHQPGPSAGIVYLDYLTWDGAPQTVLGKPDGDGVMWRRAWINGVDLIGENWPEAYRLVQNAGRGIFSQGTCDWVDYHAAASITVHLAESAGLAVHVQGMRRFYALLLCRDGQVRLIKALDGDTTLAEAIFPLEFGATYALALTAQGNQLTAALDGRVLFTVVDDDRPLTSGAVALVVEEGRIMCEAVTIAGAA